MIDINFEGNYNLALRFLSYRPRSEKEVRDKLKSKDIDNSIIEKVINKLKDYKFINDLEFAEKWIESRLKFKPRSMKLIKFELKRKGISDELIGRLIHNSELIIQDDFESAKKLVEKKIEKFKNLSKQEVYERLGRFLASKGFSWDTIKKSIDEILDKGV